ncbi:ABC transporter permease [Sulfuricystis multivorans]|uniref:ABC transporter permease n=1 Tax=Sulfuricystis multivorans TaxID=2211108 RepID=UPI0024DFF679|nr:ABC transporter permease [Sulfuricystis multivorans]
MDIMTPRQKLLLYLAVLPAPTLIHQPALLAAGFAFALLLAGKTRWRILSRSLIAILAFDLSVSLGVVLVGLWQGRIDVDWLLLANLRVLLMAYLGFWFIARCELLAALEGLPTARRLVTLTIGQIRTFERVLGDFRLAFDSRNIARPRLLDRRHHAGAQAIALLDKAMAQSTEVAQALRSRGAFD